MKTRTLLLLALACLVAIMCAGAVFFFQLSTQDPVAPPSAFRERVEVGDVSFVVESVSEQDGVLEVTIRIGGVDDTEATRGLGLIASGDAVVPEPPGEGGCTAITVAVQTCIVRFDVSGAAGDSRILIYERGDDRARWVLT